MLDRLAIIWVCLLTCIIVGIIHSVMHCIQFTNRQLIFLHNWFKAVTINPHFKHACMYMNTSLKNYKKIAIWTIQNLSVNKFSKMIKHDSISEVNCLVNVKDLIDFLLQNKILQQKMIFFSILQRSMENRQI